MYLLLHFCLFTFYGDVVHVCKTEMTSNSNKAFLSLEVQCVHAFVPSGPLRSCAKRVCVQKINHT